MAKCNNCLHNAVCKYGENRSNGMYCTGKKCKQFKDRSRFVEMPPVKIGDTAYFIIQRKVYKAEVHFMRWEQHKRYGIYSEISASVIPNYSVGASFDDFGKTVFLTEEEAEAALAKMKG